VQGGSVTSTGNMNAFGSVTAPTINTTGNYKLNGNIIINNLGKYTGDTGIETIGTVSSTGNITSAATVQGGSVTSTGNMNAFGSVTAPTINTTGNYKLNGNIIINNLGNYTGEAGIETIGTVSSTGNITSAATVQGGSVSCSGRVTTFNLTVEGTSTFTGLLRGTAVSTTTTAGTYFDHDVNPGGFTQVNHNHGQTANNSGNAVIAHAHGTNAGGTHAGHLVELSGYEYSIYGDGFRSSSGFFSTSDRRLKRDIKPITEEDAMERILKLNPVRYQWNDPSLYKRHGNLGLIAQQTEKIVPEVIISDKFGNEIQTHDVMRRCEAWVSVEETEMLFVVEKDIEPVLVGDSFEFLHFDGGKRLACKVKKVKFNDSGTTDVTVEWKPDNGNFIDSNGKIMVYGRVLTNSKSVAYDQLVPLLIKATQHMNSRIVELEKQIKKMKEDN